MALYVESSRTANLTYRPTSQYSSVEFTQSVLTMACPKSCKSASNLLPRESTGVQLIRFGLLKGNWAVGIQTHTEIEFIPNDNGSIATKLPNGEVFRDQEHGSLHHVIRRVTELVCGDFRSLEDTTVMWDDISGTKNKTQSPDWYVPECYPTELANRSLVSRHITC